MGLSTEIPIVARVYAATELTKAAIEKMTQTVATGNPGSVDDTAENIAKLYKTIYAATNF